MCLQHQAKYSTRKEPDQEQNKNSETETNKKTEKEDSPPKDHKKINAYYDDHISHGFSKFYNKELLKNMKRIEEYFDANNAKHDKDEKSQEKGEPKTKRPARIYTAPSDGGSTPGIPLLVLLLIAILISSKRKGTKESKEISFQEFRTKFLSEGKVEKIQVLNKKIARIYLRSDASAEQSGEYYYFVVGSVENLEQRLENIQMEIGVSAENFIPVEYYETPDYGSFIVGFLPTLMFIGFLLFLQKSAQAAGKAGGGPGGIFNIGKSKAKLYNQENDVKVKFKDVAGMDEAKQEIMEFVAYLKDPSKFEALGATIPKGAILSGAPGTGKTLVAKATAGEAGVPFLSVSGSEFIEMFVGVGPSRVRDLFENARKNAPCIIFIDEIDAIGKHRGKGGMVGGNDERESTLNQLLVEIDGFEPSTHVIVLAGTNRPDVLDPALTRAGRFDRHIAIDRPDIKGRKQIFLVHLRPIKTNENKDVLAERLATLTPGFTGADIHNACNEGALIAAREDSTTVTISHFEKAIERVIGGLEKKSRVLSKEEKKIVAYHEAGHAVSSWFLRHTDPLLKVSIIPRGVAALGYAQYLPKEKFLYTGEEMFERMMMTLAGRASEEIFFGKISTGAQDDLVKVYKLARAQITEYGMGKSLPNLALSSPNEDEKFVKPYSDLTSEKIDAEIQELVTNAYQQVLKLLGQHKTEVEVVAERLLKKEVLNKEDMVELLGRRPFDADSSS